MAKYNTINRSKSIDRATDMDCMVGIERVTAGGYGPAAEEAFCPSRQPTENERRTNSPDELTSDDVEMLDLGIMNDNACQEPIGSDSTWHPLTDAQRATMTLEQMIAHNKCNPATAWLRKE